MKTNETNLDDILGALSVSNIKSKQEEKPKNEPKSLKEELEETLRGLNELIDSNASILEEAKRLVETTGEPEFLEAYSNIGKSQSEAFKNKVKLLLEKEKNDITKETKEKELSIKDKLAEYTINKSGPAALPSGSTLNQTNVIMSGSREEMFNMLLKIQEKEDIKIIDNTPQPVSTQQEDQ